MDPKLLWEGVDRGMHVLSDLGLSEVTPQQGRPHVLWIVCRSSSSVCLT
jgi:hypothetical protein